jgi:tetratricopeptide (TPR) repeat protein
LVIGVVALLALAVAAAVAWQRQRSSRIDATPTFAVGFIRDDALPDSLRIGSVLTDMLATHLARVDGLSVLSNSRLLELIRPGQDSSPAGYIDAARRAGATELLEGRILTTSDPELTLEMRHVALRSGIVRRAYRVSAADRYALVDSMTRAIAHHLRLSSSVGSIADATTSSPVAYRLYEEGLRAYHQFDTKAAQRLMHAALAEDSTFAMAAYYVATLAMIDQQTLDGRHVAEARRSALRLAQRAPNRDRLMITADLLEQDQEPRALAVAETLTTRYPNDPRALMTLGRVRLTLGDLTGAAQATERAIAIDSAAETIEQTNCRLCRDYLQLADVYLLWDSLPAAQRTARRFLSARPSASQPHLTLAVAAARLGDSATAYASFRRLLALGGTDRSHKLVFDLTLEEYDVLKRDVRQLLASSSLQDWGNGAWFYLIALRNEGRLREATQFHRTGSLPGLPAPAVNPVAPDDFNEGILALERGEPRRSAAAFGRRVRFDMSAWSSGSQSRHRAWNGALQGMGLAAAGDTGALRVLADSVETWGRGSLYGRDRKAHHYLRGLVLAAEGRHEDAVRAYRAAIHSPTLGFTRVNYELGRSLMHLGRPLEAVAAVQPALRGEIDAANLYITRTELHELLAQAFVAAGVRDSAAVHYRAVTKAWARADPAFHTRRAAAQRWLRSEQR